MKPKTYYPSEIFESGGVRIDKPLAYPYQLCSSCERQHNAPSGADVVPTPLATVERLNTWNAYLAKWQIDYPVTARFSAYIDGNNHLRIDFIYLNEPDAEQPHQKALSKRAEGFLAPSLLPDDETPRWLRQNLRFHLDHELDEHLHFEDQRPFNPHHLSDFVCSDCDKKSNKELSHE